MNYDYLIVGAGLFGSVCAYELAVKGKRCLVVDKRNHVGGNLYCENMGGITVHKYGAHIFHTSNEAIWEYVNSFCRFQGFVNSPIARFNDELYSLPFNMNTFYQMWGVKTPQEAKRIIAEQASKEGITAPKNLEEQALMLVGRDIYERLIAGYTEKQWGKSPKELPAFIISRLPLRFTFDNNYFNDVYQGIPEGGYNALFTKWLERADVKLSCDFLAHRGELESMADRIIFTGAIDSYYGYRLGALEYRSLRFEIVEKPLQSFQGNAVVNYTSRDVPYTRIIEHKHFERPTHEGEYTVLTYEYPAAWTPNAEPYYSVNDQKNTKLFSEYRALADSEGNVYFGGRLGDYKYYDMHVVIENALRLTKALP